MKLLAIAALLVPIAALGQGSNPFTSRGGLVMVYPPSTNGGMATVIQPSGMAVLTPGSTTAGLQEAENFRYENGFDMYIMGGQMPGTTPGTPGPTSGGIVYNMSSTLTFRPTEGATISSATLTINCTAALGSGPCVTLDSAEITNFSFPGTQIVTAGTGPAFQVKPTNPVPLDTAFGIGFEGSVYLFAAVNIHEPASDVAAVPLIEFSEANGPIDYSSFTFVECNGSGIAIKVDDPAPGSGFAANHVNCNFVHGQTGANPAVSIGQGGGAHGSIANNHWSLFLGPGGTTSVGLGIDTHESSGIYSVDVAYPGYSHGLWFEHEASGNTVTAGQIAGMNYPIAPSDFSYGGNCSSNQIIAVSGVGPHAFPVASGSSPFVYQNNTCRPVRVVVSGGAVSQIAVSTSGNPTGGGTFNTGLTSGQFDLRQGEYMIVTFSRAPTIAGII